MRDTNIILSAKNLKKKFNNILAVKDLSFDVKEGEIFGILGPNGAGKSTTLSMISGLVHPDQGIIKIEGIDIQQKPKEAKKNIGVLLETPSFYNNLSAIDNIKIFGKFKSYKSSDIENILSRVGLLAWKNNKVKTFSQGMKRKLGISIAILGRPRLIILDEPTNALDAQSRKDILEVIKNMAIEYKTSIIVSSNLLHDIEEICDRVLLLFKGEMVFCKTISELLKGQEDCCLVKLEPLNKGVSYLKSINGVTSAELVSGGFIKVTFSGLRLAEINKNLVQNGFDVFEIFPVKKTLEDIILDMKGK
jgi:ABC-2 type transport system ATP-binding protein